MRAILAPVLLAVLALGAVSTPVLAAPRSTDPPCRRAACRAVPAPTSTPVFTPTPVLTPAATSTSMPTAVTPTAVSTPVLPATMVPYAYHTRTLLPVVLVDRRYAP